MSIHLLREATVSDIADLSTLYIAFHEFHARGVHERLRIPDTYDKAELWASLKRIIADEKAAIFVAEVDGQIVGLAEVYLRHDEVGPLTMSRAYGYMQSLMVLEAFRGEGRGSQLVAKVEEWASERGASEIRLETWEFAEGPLRFYEGLRYRTVKRMMVKEIER